MLITSCVLESMNIMRSDGVLEKLGVCDKRAVRVEMVP